MIQRRELFASAHVRITDVNLRHRASPGLVHHFLALARIEIDSYLLDLGYALRAEQHLRAQAEGADGGRVHPNLGHLLLQRQDRLPPGPDSAAPGENLFEALLAPIG